MCSNSSYSERCGLTRKPHFKSPRDSPKAAPRWLQTGAAWSIYPAPQPWRPPPAAQCTYLYDHLSNNPPKLHTVSPPIPSIYVTYVPPAHPPVYSRTRWHRCGHTNMNTTPPCIRQPTLGSIQATIHTHIHNICPHLYILTIHVYMFTART